MKTMTPAEARNLASRHNRFASEIRLAVKAPTCALCLGPVGVGGVVQIRRDPEHGGRAFALCQDCAEDEWRMS